MNVNSVFNINYESLLSGQDYEILTQLYLPIMGIDSFSLYLYLYNLNVNENFEIKKLVDALNFTTSKFVEKAFAKLEALSLVKVYFNEQKGYIFELLTPVCKYSFFENPILSSFLHTQIGEIEFNKLNKAPRRKPRGYDDVTKNFDDVFEFTNYNAENIFNKIFKLKTKPAIKIENKNFDYLFFKMNFDSDFIDSKVLDDEEFKNHILTTSFNFDLNEEQMKEVVMNTIEIDKDLKLTDISKNARKYFQASSNHNTKRVVATKESDVFIKSALDDEQYKLIDFLENASAAELLKGISKKTRPSASEISMHGELIKSTNFPPSVINLMFLYVNSFKEGELPGYEYFLKIANTWARAGVETVMDAFAYIEKQNVKHANQTTSKTKYSKSKKSTPLPDWYDDYIKQLPTEQEEEKLTDEEIAKILEKAKEVF